MRSRWSFTCGVEVALFDLKSHNHLGNFPCSDIPVIASHPSGFGKPAPLQRMHGTSILWSVGNIQRTNFVFSSLVRPPPLHRGQGVRVVSMVDRLVSRVFLPKQSRYQLSMKLISPQLGQDSAFLDIEALQVGQLKSALIKSFGSIPLFFINEKQFCQMLGLHLRLTII